MKAINHRAKKVMDRLIYYIHGANDHKIIDNTEGTFMPVHVEHVTDCRLGQIFSIAHYYTEDGDPMRDPEMEFLKGGDEEFYPVSFWQDAPTIRDEPVKWLDGEIVSYNAIQQADLVAFANMWMRNIKEQQGLVI